MLKNLSTRQTPQTEAADPRQAKNNAGGFSFTLDTWARLDRFLVLGVDSGTYYVNARKLALDNAAVIDEALKLDAKRAIEVAVDISVTGRAKDNDPVLFLIARASAHDDVEVRRFALAQLPKVARTGTHLFHFIAFAQNHRGWGPALVKAVAAWYTDRDADKVAYDLVKYRQRDGWSHRDVLRKAHPRATTPEHAAAFAFGAGKEFPGGQLAIIEGFERIQKAADAHEAAELVREYKLPRETVPTEFLETDVVWRALLDSGALPLGALIRNLGVLTDRGILKPLSDDTAAVVDRLTDDGALAKARIHPIAVLNALVTYTNGKGLRGQLRWDPTAAISDALDDAFYKTFGNVTVTGKRTMLALDISGSMSWQPCTGAVFTPRVGSAAMAMITDRVEPHTLVTAFSMGLSTVDISNRKRLDDVVKKTDHMSMSGTDCALPMLWALEHKVEVETFVVYTDSETWAGRMHPHEALTQYRERMGIPAKMIVVGMTSTGFTIAKPGDAGMLDVVGFDTAAPEAMAQFVLA